MDKKAGHQGLAVLVDPKLFEKQTDDAHNLLVLEKAPDNTASYWAGFAWDKAGQFTSFEAWKAYVDEFAQRLRLPIAITVSDSQGH